jgi:hypothetical protein
MNQDERKTNAAFNRKKSFSTSKLNLNLRKKLVKCHIWSIAFYGAKNWTLQKLDQKHVGSFETWFWRRTEKISWTDRVRNEEVLHRVKVERNIIRTLKRRKADWIGHFLRRNCLLKPIIKWKMEEGTEVPARREEDISSYWMTLTNEGIL